MMFEKQCKSGIEPFKASSSAIESTSGVSSDAMKDSPAKSDLESSQVDLRSSGPDQANGNTAVEKNSPKLGGKQDAPESQASEDPKQHASESEDSCQAPKRPRTDE